MIGIEFDIANTSTLGSCSQPQCNPTISTSNNRFTSGQGYTYDLSGNVITDAEGRTFTFDAENKQTLVKDSNNATIGQYYYDGDGKRVKKAATTETIVFVYDATGRLVEEYSGSTLQTAYVYAGSRLLTTETATGTNYLTSDHLGSPRINTDGSGNVSTRHDYMPFGEEIFSVGGRTSGLGYSSDNVRKKFTGYERDSESGLDFAQARYYANTLGRFSSPDSFTNDTDRSNPQSWNLYVYVRNSPLVTTDPTGKVGDYYSSDGRWLGHDGKNDGKVYFATLIENRGAEVDLDRRTIRETTIDAVLKAQNDAVQLTPGTNNQAVQALAGTVADSSIAGATGIIKGIGNSLIDTVNTLTNPLGPAGAAAGIPNPVAIPNIPTSNSLEKSYNDATKVGVATGLVVAGGAVAPRSSVSVVPETEPGLYLAGDAPKLTAPGTRVLEGQHVNNLGRVEPWRAHYDPYGRLVGRTDFNAGNKAANIPSIHHHTFGIHQNGTIFETGSHLPGEFKP